MPPNTSVKLTLLRKGAEQTVTLTLGELPNQREASVAPNTRKEGGSTEVPRIGLTLAPAGEVAGAGSDGVVVTNVEPNGIAAEHGLRTGDVIMEVAGKRVGNPAEVRDAFGDAQRDGRRTVLVRVKSGDSIRFVAIRIARA
jgi:serine protease Do